jgi:hypothetical protein
MPEKWKRSEDPHLSNYEISSEGRVRNHYTGRILKQRLNKGYFIISLRNKTFSVHRLVALAFVPNPDPKTRTWVDHEDRIRTHTVASNLRWLTPVESGRNRNCAATKARVPAWAIEKIVCLYQAGHSLEEIRLKIRNGG